MLRSPEISFMPFQNASSRLTLVLWPATTIERFPKRFGLDPIRDIRVPYPMNRGGVGARSLNIELGDADRE